MRTVFFAVGRNVLASTQYCRTEFIGWQLWRTRSLQFGEGDCFLLTALFIKDRCFDDIEFPKAHVENVLFFGSRRIDSENVDVGITLALCIRTVISGFVWHFCRCYAEGNSRRSSRMRFPRLDVGSRLHFYAAWQKISRVGNFQFFGGGVNACSIFGPTRS